MTQQIWRGFVSANAANTELFRIYEGPEASAAIGQRVRSGGWP
jgi:hypothetical protein